MTSAADPFNQPDNRFNTLEDWTWVGCYGGYYLTSDAMQIAGFEHGFFTRLWHNRGPDALAAYLGRSECPPPPTSTRQPGSERGGRQCFSLAWGRWSRQRPGGPKSLGLRCRLHPRSSCRPEQRPCCGMSCRLERGRKRHPSCCNPASRPARSDTRTSDCGLGSSGQWGSIPGGNRRCGAGWTSSPIGSIS